MKSEYYNNIYIYVFKYFINVIKKFLKEIKTILYTIIFNFLFY